jgi:hypothetical protein
MSAVSSPELLVITATSPRPRKPQRETYIAHARLRGGKWTSAMHLQGTSQLKGFLKNNRVDEKKADSAIAQLSITRGIILSNVQDESLLKRALRHADGSSREFPAIWT